MKAGLSIISCLLALVVAAASALAHPALGTIANVSVKEGPDGPFVEVIVTHDALAYALNDTSTRITDPQMYALLDGPRADLGAALQDGRERFQAGFKVFADGEPLELELVQSPTLDLIDQWKADNPSERLPVKLEFIARTNLPTGTRAISVRAPAVLDQVILGVARLGRETSYLPVEPGETSPEFDVSWVTRSPAGEQADAAEGSPANQAESNAKAHTASEPGVLAIAWRYIVLGYEHIMPEGTDHELFILGLFLLNSRFRDLIWQTTTFTLAHTCTLTLATLGLVHIPSGVVEPIIAATIAFIAIENLFVTKIHPWRPAVAFLFGLAHGLGFASGLLSIGLPPHQLATGIVAFNVGVEGGHLTIIVLAFLTLGWFRGEKWYRSRIAVPLSVVIALIALYWFVQRLV
ncbi:MAG: HupE/UreJ family protein [Phycisphaeraceae bacterium]|nr:MAG: HupE/UreJ family protein [Phycisphaeraceae bacterium]